MIENDPTPTPDDEPTAALRILVQARTAQATVVAGVSDEIVKLEARLKERDAFRERSYARLIEINDAIDVLRNEQAAAAEDGAL